ncbi:MAG: hypothetical protein WAW90_03430 [Minisyncoccia bacterium]
MAFLPTIPTSFVPRSASTDRRHLHTEFADVISFLAYILLVLSFALALGVFLYGRILDASKASKEASLAKAETSVDATTVESFVKLRDQLSSGQKLLANHVSLSGFFVTLEKLLPSTVRFSSLHVLVDDSGVARVTGTGVAQNFNALAAASGNFASDGRFKDAIFSKMNVNKDKTVSFGFSTTLDQSIVAFYPDNILQAMSATVPVPTTKPTP